jgi:ATP-dependent DNA helicase RecG
LLLYAPRRHEDRRNLLTIRQLQLHEAATTRGRIVALGTNYYRKKTKSVFEIVLEDGTARLHCRWWNLPFMERVFEVGDEVMVFGKPRLLKPRTIDHPETEIIDATSDEPGERAERSIHLERIVPIYGLTEGLPQRWLRGLVWRTLARFGGHVSQLHREFPMSDLPTRAEAVQRLHFPETMAEAEQARQRLALDEFVGLQLAIHQRRKNLEANARGFPCAGDNRLIRPFLHQLGFKLTAAQTRVLRELRADLGGRFPMRRLLQGDVGAGKTAVAACCALMALESGFNVALMAPTEILAEQHYANFASWFRPLGVPVELQTGSRKTVEGRESRVDDQRDLLPSALSSQLSTLTIGTHALIQSAFTMDRLGLVIIDEQHKFGVAQRETLVRKGRYPHLLVMTATPIPRTLGLTLYGDLDISAIDEVPAGRGQVRTFVRGPEQLPRVHEFMKQKIAEGRQAYVVYPRVEEADLRTGAKAVAKEFERLQSVFSPHRVGLLHGRLRPEEKERVMADFRANRVQVLLATSVIEVGIDVPNATMLLVENAEHFGLAQLHQLRGRIGRGAHESWCILVAEQKTDEAKERLKVLAATNDGFAIAEADLRLRGPGDLLGQQQSGMPALRFGDLARDRAIIERAKELVAGQDGVGKS